MHATTLGRTLIATAFVLGTVQAHAVPMLRLTTGDETITITDGGAGDDHAASGVVLFSGLLTGWGINVTTGLSRPVLGDAYHPILDLLSVNVSSEGAGSLSILFTDTDFAPVAGGAASLAEIGGTTTGNVSYSTFYDPGNIGFAQTASLPSLGVFGPGAFSGTIGGSVLSATAYSLTMLVTITHSGNQWQYTSFDASLKVPEPGSLLLLGTGLLAMGFVLRRRRRLAATPL